jgi:Calcineurin-like phosphoesterase
MMRMAKLFFPIIAAISVSLWANGQEPKGTWYFAVAGDSRNCGDVVVPAIADDAKKQNVAFYWHLGDLRRTSGPDEDFIAEKAHEGKPADLAEYEKDEWDDFIQNQIQVWGDTPYYLGIGNHETTGPKSRAQFVEKFHAYLDRPDVREQRLKDNPRDEEPHTYYHWMRDGIDFIFLDNATKDQFDDVQMRWIKDVLERDRSDAAINTLVVGMHEALPESISANHSMNQATEAAVRNGRAVYELLLKMQNESHKLVYVLASHSHYFMQGIFNTAYWREHGGVLPGWIIGTAGAQRYALPADASNAQLAKTNVYGYLLGTVNPGGERPGTIKFEFREIKEGGIPSEVVDRFTKTTVHECFVGNRQGSIHYPFKGSADQAFFVRSLGPSRR